MKRYFHKTSLHLLDCIINKTIQKDFICCSTSRSRHLFWGDALVVFYTDEPPFEYSISDIFNPYMRSPWDEARFNIDILFSSPIEIYTSDSYCPYVSDFTNFGYARKLICF